MEPKIKTQFNKIMDLKAAVMLNPKVFDITFTPAEIIERTPTIDVYKNIAPFINYKSCNHLLLTGHPGSGKTVAALFIKQMLSSNNDIQVDYINCNSKRPEEILYTLLNTEQSKNDLLIDYLTSRKKDTLLILDEVDKSPRMPHLLYQLSRINEIIPDYDKKINLILISNHPLWEDTLKTYIRSSLQLKKIIFLPYNEDELFNILKKRVELGFNPQSVSDDLLKQLASEVVQKKQGDCRVAIKAIFRAGILAEQNNRGKITEEDINKSLKDAITEIEVKRVSGLTINHFIVLCTAFEETTSFEHFFQVYEKKVNEICGPKFKSLKSTAVFQAIEYLQLQGLIEKENIMIKESNGPPIRSLHIKAMIKKKIVEDELFKRIQKIEHMQKS